MAATATARLREHAGHLGAHFLRAPPTLGVPALGGAGGSRLLFGRQLLKKARRRWREGEPLSRVARRRLLEAAFFEATLRTLGSTGVIAGDEQLFPTLLVPDFQGPHFDEALHRIVVPGRGPFVLHFSLTGDCASACTYCYASVGGGKGPDLGDARALQTARQIADSGIPLVILSGGEPFTHFERLLAVVEILAGHCELRVATSGIGVTPDRLAALKAAGLTAVAVSLGGADAATVNRRRGHPRAFSSATTALAASAAAGLNTFATVTVSGDSVPDDAEIEALLQLTADLHPEVTASFVPVFSVGRGRDAGGGFGTPEAWAPVARRIAAAIRRSGRRAAVYLSPLEVLMGCVGAGGQQLSVDVAGNLAVCISATSLGNLHQEDFASILPRYLDAPTRLKRGFFCAHVAEGEARATPDETRAALEDFVAAFPDALYQRIYDLAGPAIRWLAR